MQGGVIGGGQATDRQFEKIVKMGYLMISLILYLLFSSSFIVLID